MTFGCYLHVRHPDLAASFCGDAHIALGLLVDVPVVAGDGIKRGSRRMAARSGSVAGATKLSTAIFYANLNETSIGLFLPLFLMPHATPESFAKPPHRHEPRPLPVVPLGGGPCRWFHVPGYYIHGLRQAQSSHK